MNILVAIDSFKESLSSLCAGQAVKEAALAAFDKPCVTVMPVADGGEGTVEAVAGQKDGKRIRVTVTGPLFEPVDAVYCILEDSMTAVIEMASAAGLMLVPPEKRDPLCTTTYGVGELIADAIRKGCRNFLIGIGGSATNDGGIGILGALGFGFFNAQNKPVPLCAKGLEQLCRIESANALKELDECTFHIACDVKNPLCGAQGCSAVFAPQKGATEEAVIKMDKWLKEYAACVCNACPGADPALPGAGAAGGLGFAFQAFLHGKLQRGIDTVLEAIGLEDAVRRADLVITGEGRLDAQTVMGKAPAGVARLAKKYGKTVLAFAGCVTEDALVCNDNGIDAYFPILRTVTTLEEALCPAQAYRNLKDTAYQVFRLMAHIKQESTKPR